jgi:hypothetical protein
MKYFTKLLEGLGFSLTKGQTHGAIFVKSMIFTLFKTKLAKTPYPLALRGVKSVYFGLDVTSVRYVLDGLPKGQVLAEMGCLVKE